MSSALANVTDPDSRMMRGAYGFVQGYNAQAVTTEGQITVAAELSTDSPDARLLAPMVTAARHERQTAGIDEAPRVIVADGGYWNVPQIEQVIAAGSQVLVNPDAPGPPAEPTAASCATNASTDSTPTCNGRSPATVAARPTEAVSR